MEVELNFLDVYARGTVSCRMQQDVLFLSIRPKYVARILDGTKTVELRRVCPNIQPGQSALIYGSSPTMALLAIATIDHLDTSPPDDLWPRVRGAAGVTSQEYLDYFAGANSATGIWIRDVSPLVTPVSLSELRRRWPWFQPPQSYRYLSAELDQLRLTNLAPRAPG